MTSSGEQKSVWLIRHEQTRTDLGVRDRVRDHEPEFGARVPLFYSSLRSARNAWVRLCVDRGYLVKGVTLPNEGPRFHPGPDFKLLPQVRFVRVLQLEVAFDLPSYEELRIHEKP